MDVFVPLHALVIVVSTRPHDDASRVEMIFPEHEIISMHSIRWDMWGDEMRPELASVLHAEMRHRITLKLSLGERVVVHGANMRVETRVALAAAAHEQGAYVIYLLTNPNDHRIKSDSGLLSGDGVADAVVSVHDAIIPVRPLPSNPLSSLRERFRGVSVVGDVHGSLKGLKAAAAWANGRDHFLWFLGDVIDYGPQSLDCLVEVHRLIMHGRAAMVVGNHERKIARWFDEHRNPLSNLRLSEGNKVTIDALGKLGSDDRLRWSGKLRAVLGRASAIAQVGNVTMAHAALHPDVWDRDPTNRRGIEHFALYGEAPPPMNGQPFRHTYAWVDSVPSDVLVFVGHDMRSSLPLAIQGAKGGRVVFLDTGSGKGGTLSSADLRFDPDGLLRLENFNRHD